MSERMRKRVPVSWFLICVADVACCLLFLWCSLSLWGALCVRCCVLVAHSVLVFGLCCFFYRFDRFFVFC